MLTGEYKHSLDEKGRLMIPQAIRQSITGNAIVITRGLDRCIWLFPPEEWKTISQNLINATSPFQEKTRLIQRRILAPAQELEIDRSGRISIPATLREYAALKKECIILGMIKSLEVWDEGTYSEYWNENESRFRSAAEELGDKISFRLE